MKNKLLLVTSVCGTLCLFAVFAQKQKVSEAECDMLIKKGSSGVLAEFQPGIWRIDSVAENQLIINRLIHNDTIQIMNFRPKGIFSVMEVTPEAASDRVIGNWRTTQDSLYILGERGGIVMRYGYKFDDKILVLKGNFEISPPYNRNKPTFYLSKYAEK